MTKMNTFLGRPNTGRLLLAVRDHLSDADRAELHERTARVDRLNTEANLEKQELHRFLQERYERISRDE
jgi:hypothetical protein